MQESYNLLPTDPRFLALEKWECEYLYWRHQFWVKIRKLTQDSREITFENVVEDDHFAEEIAKRDAADTAAGKPNEPDLGEPEPPPGPMISVAKWSAPGA